MKIELVLAFGLSIVYTLFVFNEGNENNFKSEVDCLNKCAQNKGAEAPGTNSNCELEASPGPCLAYFERFFYNKTSGKCEKFVYGIFNKK
jgi:hypothetical protein